MTTDLLFSGFVFLISFCSFVSVGNGVTKNSDSSRQWIKTAKATFQGQNYTLVYDPVLTWTEAEKSCVLENLILTKIETPESLKFHLELLAKAVTRQAWTGASNLNRDQFVWLENEAPVSSFVWGRNEPNNAGGIEHFVHLDTVIKGVNDNSEPKHFPFICKTKDPVQITETTSTSTTTTTTEKTTEPTTTTTEKTTEPTTTTTTTTEKTSTTEKAEATTESVGFCTSPGFSPDPDDCKKYHLCGYNEVGDLWHSVLTCPDSTVWCQEKVKCQSAEICPCFVQL